jgi:hypothetical protein
MRTTKQLRGFYAGEVFRLQLPITGSQGSETVSLPYGTSAFDRREYIRRVNRMLIEGVETQNLASLQFAYGIDFLSIQASRLWMEYPSRGKDEAIFDPLSSIFDLLSSILDHCLAADGVDEP